jgi:hypothetical protein
MYPCLCMTGMVNWKSVAKVFVGDGDKHKNTIYNFKSDC